MPPKKLSDRERKEREKERKRKAREEESEEAKSTRLEYQRQYDADQRQKMTDDERGQLLKLKSKSEAERIAKMTEEDAQLLKDKKKERTRKVREEETAETKSARLDYQRQYKAEQRQKMTDDERAQILKLKSKSEAERIAKMTEEDAALMKDRRKQRTREAREEESAEIKSARLKYQRQYRAEERQKMTDEEKGEVLKWKSISEAERVAKMSDEERKEMQKQKQSYSAGKRKMAKGKTLTIEEASHNFQLKCKDLPEFVCTCCQRLLWRKSVVLFKESNYNFECDIVRLCFATKYRKETKPGEVYICTTCHNDLKKKKPLMPAQAVANGLELPPLPNIPAPNDLERRLFSVACPFMKIGALPRGGQYRLQGPCINVPTNVQTVCDFLPRLPDEAGVVLLKFKRKLAYKGHYMYDTVRPAVVLAWLQWLKENNPLYKDIDVRSNWHHLLSEYEERGKYMMSVICKIALL